MPVNFTYAHNSWQTLNGRVRKNRTFQHSRLKLVKDSVRKSCKWRGGAGGIWWGRTGTGPLGDKKWHRWKKERVNGSKVELRFNAQTKGPLWRLPLSRALSFRFKEKASVATWMSGRKKKRGGVRGGSLLELRPPEVKHPYNVLVKVYPVDTHRLWQATTYTLTCAHPRVKHSWVDRQTHKKGPRILPPCLKKRSLSCTRARSVPPPAPPDVFQYQGGRATV